VVHVTFFLDFNLVRLCTLQYKTKVQLLLGYPTVLVVSDLQGHTKSMIFISSEREYATSY